MSDTDYVVDEDEVDFIDEGDEFEEDFSQTSVPRSWYRMALLWSKKRRTNPNDKYPVSEKNPQGGQWHVQVGLQIVDEVTYPEANGTKIKLDFWLGSQWGRDQFLPFYLYATGVNLADKKNKIKMALLTPSEDNPIMVYGFVEPNLKTYDGPNGEKVQLPDGHRIQRWGKLPEVDRSFDVGPDPV